MIICFSHLFAYILSISCFILKQLLLLNKYLQQQSISDQYKFAHQMDSDRSSFDKNINQPVSTVKQPQQFKALFLKNLRLQSKQKGTNCCQILTPILCILFTYLMKSIAQQNMPVGAKFTPVYYPIKFANFTTFDQKNFNNRNPLQWIMYDCNGSCNQTLLGSNDGEGNSAGLLGNISNTFVGNVLFHPNPQNLIQQQNRTVPFFLNKDKTIINSSINNQLYNRIELLNTLNFSDISKKGGFDFIPDGTYNISLLNDTNINFDVKVKDARSLQLHRSNGITYMNVIRYLKDNETILVRQSQYTSYTGILMITDWLTSQFTTLVTGKTVQSGVYFMPEDQSGVSFVDTIISFVAVLIFPVSLSLLFPVFLYTVVLEKQQKLIQMMKMNGMKISSYWTVYFIFNLVLSLLTNIIFVILGIFLTNMRFFLESDPILLAIVLLGWSLAQIGMAVFFQTFLNKSRSANIIGYLISIWTSMIGSTLCIGVYQYPNQLPVGARFFAPFAFTRIIYLMLSGCSEGRCFGNIGNIPNQMKYEIASLYLNFAFFFILGAYLFEIIPQELGVTRSPLFPFSMLLKYIKTKFNKNEKLSDRQIDEDYEYTKYLSKNDEDNFSKKERSDLLSLKDMSEYPLVINNLRKLYYKQGIKGMYAAVKSFNLKVGEKQTFGLLGPNGAGKTTLISMITGMFQPNYGNAWVGGYDIRTSVEKAQLQMGVCPQFDLLWPQLTVEEHLYFYARLKGVAKKEMSSKIRLAIQQVRLSNFKNFKSSELSGGMKRRLSVAISLVGDPKIVFLDQPSTGLDPENRRQLWQVLAKCQKQRAIFITTHMMQQADALCNRVGIITKGVLRTVGPQVSLKKFYGGGYRLSISVAKQQRKLVNRESLHEADIQKGNNVEDYQENDVEEGLKRSINSFIQTQQKQKELKCNKRMGKIIQFINDVFPGSMLLKKYNGYMIFKVPPNYKVSQIFEKVQNMQKQLEVKDVAITNSSLQDVFMNVVKIHEKKYPSSNEFQQIDDVPKNGNEQKDDIFVSFPTDSANTNPNNINKTGKKDDGRMENPIESSIISKKRQSVMSNEEKKEQTIYKSLPGDQQNEKNVKSKKDDDEDSDYY